MDIDIRALTPDDLPAIAALDSLAFADDPAAWERADAVGLPDFARTFGAHLPGRDGLAGMYTSLDLHVTCPGPLGTLRALPVEGLGLVSVHPDARRRGVLTTMIGHHLRTLHDRGVATCALHASEPGIYGRFGYGVASLDVMLTLDRTPHLRVPRLDAAAEAVATHTLHGVDTDDVHARLEAIERLAAPRTLGAVRLPAAYSRFALHDIPRERIGHEPYRAVLATRDGVDVGYALFARRSEGERPDDLARVNVHHLIAADPPALLALTRRLLDLDLTSRVRMSGRSLDDPLYWWAGGPRAARAEAFDALWLRPVDVGAHLSARGYAAPLDVVLDVRDPAAPWNTRHWRVSVAEDGTAQCSPTPDAADAQVDVHALGSAHLGLRGFTALAAAGAVDGAPATLAALDRAFATGSRPLGSRSF